LCQCSFEGLVSGEVRPSLNTLWVTVSPARRLGKSGSGSPPPAALTPPPLEVGPNSQRPMSTDSVQPTSAGTSSFGRSNENVPAAEVPQAPGCQTLGEEARGGASGILSVRLY